MSSSRPSALWLFAHRALASLFLEDPKRFAATLDSRGAVGVLEQQWAWALKAAGQNEPVKPPLRYGIDRPRDGLAIVWMTFHSVTKTGVFRLGLCGPV